MRVLVLCPRQNCPLRSSSLKSSPPNYAFCQSSPSFLLYRMLGSRSSIPVLLGSMIPVMNSMPPLRPSLDACQNLPPPNFHSDMIHKAVASSSTRPLIHSQVGPRSGFARGMATVPPLHLREPNGRRGRVTGYKRSHISQLKKPSQEIIIISDDEEEIDLTLKL